MYEEWRGRVAYRAVIVSTQIEASADLIAGMESQTIGEIVIGV